MTKNERSFSRPSSIRPTITLPPRGAGDILFSGDGGASPGPMTLVSNYFSDNDPGTGYRSFSQLLTGAISDEDSSDLRFKQHRAPGLSLTEQPAMFTVPPGMSPASLLNIPNWNQGTLGVSLGQTLSLISVHDNLHFQFPTEFSSGLSAAPSLALQQHPPSASIVTTTHQHVSPSVQDHDTIKESSNLSHSNQKSLSSSIVVDKPADDGYNWRKYGQKQVKGSEFPRSYYKCTHPKCPVKKKVERSQDGQITEIIYKGQHNHQPPQMSKRGKDSGYLNGNTSHQEYSEFSNDGQTGNLNRTRDREINSENLSGLSDSEDEGDAETKNYERYEDEPDAKRRNPEVRVADPAASHRTVTEPRIIVQTTSEVDLLDDGYRWRKYGQKVVKGNPYPRSYYKCTSQACNVRKHVERAASDPKAVITTYEGKHTHDVPAARNSSHNTANNNALQSRPQNALSDKHHSLVRNNDPQQITLIRFKEELT